MRDSHLRAQARRSAPAAAASAFECEECGEPIPEQRRAAVRGVQRCIECQRSTEHMARMVAR